MTQRQSGIRVPDHEAPNRLGNALNGALGQGNFQRRSLGVGDPRKPDQKQAARAQWVPVKLTGSSGAEVEIIHSLGAVPTHVEIGEWEGGTGALIVNASSKDRWTETTARVTVTSTDGSSLAGRLARFRVWGA